jgi:hypothetical protein
MRGVHRKKSGSLKLFGHAGQNFPKERVKAGNEFSMTRGHGRPKKMKGK